MSDEQKDLGTSPTWELNKLLKKEDFEELDKLYSRQGPPLDRRGAAAAPRRCNWICHRWSKWWITQQGSLGNQHGTITGKYVFQQRLCVRCGIVDMRSEQIT